jgi:hypothetical protein
MRAELCGAALAAWNSHSRRVRGEILTRNPAAIAEKRKMMQRQTIEAAKVVIDVGDHLPIEGNTRRRCSRCALNKMEKRTKTICCMCNVPLR